MWLLHPLFTHFYSCHLVWPTTSLFIASQWPPKQSSIHPSIHPTSLFATLCLQLSSSFRVRLAFLQQRGRLGSHSLSRLISHPRGVVNSPPKCTNFLGIFWNFLKFSEIKFFSMDSYGTKTLKISWVYENIFESTTPRPPVYLQFAFFLPHSYLMWCVVRAVNTKSSP